MDNSLVFSYWLGSFLDSKGGDSSKCSKDTCEVEKHLMFYFAFVSLLKEKSTFHRLLYFLKVIR